MSGTNPKYLPIPKKIPYNIRLPKPLLDKLNAYAELTGNTTTDIVIGALNDFIKDKTVYNTYLSNVKGISIKLPLIATEKDIFINSNIGIDETYSAYDSFVELVGYSATTEAYEILKIPNNLDVFSESFGYTTSGEKLTATGNHSGIEFVVIPDYYTFYDNDDYGILGALYCLYFRIEMDKLKDIKMVLNAKSKDEIITAIEENKIKTKK